MKRVKILCASLGLVVALGLLSGCSKSEATNSSAKLTDGVFKVEYKDYDSHGYKGQLELTVSGGKITDAKYDEVTKDGKKKSEDEKYKKQMEEASQTYPKKAYEELVKQVVNKQTSSVDGVAGATQSTDSFKALAKYAIENMSKKGVTKAAQIAPAK